MGQLSNRANRTGLLALLATASLFLLVPAAAGAAFPGHGRLKALDVSGLNHACGVAVDSKGDVYASSAGESKIKVFNTTNVPSLHHELLTQIEDSNEPCGLAVTSTGDLYVSEKATGNVVRFHPSEYPPTGSTTYSETTIDASGLAKGIAVDRYDNTLYVAEGTRVSAYDAAGALVLVNEVQGIRINASGGTYELEFKGEKTAPIAFNASGAAIKAPLEALSSIGAGNVSVSGTDVTFTGALAHEDVPQLKAISALSGNETQKVTVKATAGTYKLQFKGEKTAPIPFNAPASEPGGAVNSLQEFLEALPSIAPGDVSVSGGPGDLTGSSPYLVSFEGAYANQDVAEFGYSPLGLSGQMEVTTPTKGASASVATTTAGFDGRLGEGLFSEATGVAAYAYPAPSGNTDRYLWVADAAGLGADRLYLFGGTAPGALKLRNGLSGGSTPDGSFGFGAAGASLAADPGNRTAENSEAKCTAGIAPVPAQACTAGHLYLYDAQHRALDEFDASGEYLGQTRNAAFVDAEPSALAIDRSGTASDGTLYLTSGAATGDKALAFGPTPAPSRPALGTPISKVLAGALAVTTDAHGYVYAATGPQIHIYTPAGTDLGPIVGGKQLGLIEDPHTAWDLAVDSSGKVYVLDRNSGLSAEAEVTYYTPSAYPPTSSTTYTRHEVLVTPDDFPAASPLLKAIAVDPGPGPGKDRLFVTSLAVTHVYKPASEGSGLLDSEFAKGLSDLLRQSIAVNGARGSVYFGINGKLIAVVAGPHGEETLARIDETGGPAGPGGFNPLVAVDQSNGHMVEYDAARSTAREYDASGSFVAEFGNFTEGLGKFTRVAIDSSCAIHDPPLDETTEPTCKAFDPANGNVYVAYENTNPNSAAFKGVTAFGPLAYPAPAKHKVTVERKGAGAGTVTGGSPADPNTISCGATCSHEYPETEVVTLAATASLHSEFIEWEEGCENPEPTEADCEVTPSENLTVKARFEPEEGTEYPLTVKKAGAGESALTSVPEGIDCDPGCDEEEAEFPEGSEVTLTALAPQGSELLAWSGCEAETISASEGTCTVKMTEEKTVELEAGVEHPLLTVEKEGNGEGTVTSSPAGIACGATCTHKFELEEEVLLEAKADEGSLFAGFSGCDEEPEPEPGVVLCEVEMDEARTVTASFEALPVVIPKPAFPTLYTEATLRAEIDPVGLETEYRFEYLDLESYEEQGGFEGPATKRTPIAHLPAAEVPLAVSADLFGLAEGTEYLFRAVAKNAVGRTPGQARAFVTQQRRAAEECPNALYRFGLSANLPDCRAYELLTPAETNGATLAALFVNNPAEGFNQWLTPPRGAGSGEAFSYASTTTLPGFDGSGAQDGYLARRAAGEHPEAGWSSELQSPTYVQGGASGSGALALNGGPDQLYSFWEAKPKYSLEGGLAEGNYLRTPAGFEAVGQGSLGEDLEAVPEYVSAGGAHVIFSSKAHLEAAAPPQGTTAIYDREAGSASAEVVSTSPAGAGIEGTYLGATEDGAAVAFGSGGVLYLNRGGTSTEIATGSPIYAGISADGKRVFYVAAASQPAALFACDTTAGPCAGPGAHAPAQIAANGTFVNVSAEGSHAFFTSTQALTGTEENEAGEKAKAGQPNLYAWDGAGTRFVAILDPQDLASFGEAAFHPSLGTWTAAIAAHPTNGHGFWAVSPARSAPAGTAFAFQSHAQLTDYDNEGVGEIYRYDPTSSERLLCVSCDPTGTPPGSIDAELQSSEFTSGLDTRTAIPNITDDGQEVFFQSPDRLLPEDANEVQDVYEWKAKGTGGCARPGGCLALISSGQGEVPSFLYGMSADGHDVFFRTKERLLGMDVAGSFSIYDARVGGGIPEPIEAAPCQGDACQGQGALPPSVPNPASTGSGEAGGGEEGSAPAPCAKGKHKVKGRCVASKHHKRRHKRNRQAAKANRGGKR